MGTLDGQQQTLCGKSSGGDIMIMMKKERKEQLIFVQRALGN
jgi:hypothetical protein